MGGHLGQAAEAALFACAPAPLMCLSHLKVTGRTRCHDSKGTRYHKFFSSPSGWLIVFFFFLYFTMFLLTAPFLGFSSV